MNLELRFVCQTAISKLRNELSNLSIMFTFRSTSALRRKKKKTHYPQKNLQSCLTKYLPGSTFARMQLKSNPCTVTLVQFTLQHERRIYSIYLTIVATKSVLKNCCRDMFPVLKNPVSEYHKLHCESAGTVCQFYCKLKQKLTLTGISGRQSPH